jgi:hypothetical protein
VLALVSEAAPTRAIVCAGAGGFELANITLTQGIHVAGPLPSAEAVLAKWAQIADRKGEFVPGQGFDQSRHELEKAGFVFTETTEA